MRTLRLYIGALLFAIAMMLPVLPPEPLLAHADDRLLQWEKTQVGLYQLTLWTAPTRLRTGEVHVETMVFDQAGNLDKQCAVFVTLTALEPSLPPLSAFSVPGAVEGLREAAFQVDEPGRYYVEATVVDSRGEGGKVAFEVEIIRLPLIVPLLIHLLFGASLVATVWFIRSGVGLWFGV